MNSEQGWKEYNKWQKRMKRIKQTTNKDEKNKQTTNKDENKNANELWIMKQTNKWRKKNETDDKWKKSWKKKKLNKEKTKWRKKLNT